MKHRHIAIIPFLGNAHIYPVLGVCSELVRRGHRVTFATNSHWAPEIRQTGAEPVIFREVTVQNCPDFLQASPFYDQIFWTTYASIIGPRIMLNAASALPQLEGYYRANLPDLFIDDRYSFLGRILAARLGRPVIQTDPHVAPYKKHFFRESGVFMNPAPMLAFSKLLDHFLQAYGVKASDNLWHAADLNIYFIPREFQACGESFDERFCFVGPCIDRPTRSAWKNNGGGRPLVLVSGSQADGGTAYFRAMINAFSDTEFFVVLSPGANISDDAFGPLPANFEINRDAYNFQILPHATLAVSQGGTGTLMECLYYGVPILAVPRMPIHAESAYRLAELRLGLNLPEKMMSVDNIKQNVAKILADVELATRIARMQQILRDSGGAKMAASRIEQFLDRARTL